MMFQKFKKLFILIVVWISKWLNLKTKFTINKSYWDKELLVRLILLEERLIMNFLL